MCSKLLMFHSSNFFWFPKFKMFYSHEKSENKFEKKKIDPKIICFHICLFFSDSVPKEEQKRPVQESAPTKPVQSVAPQAREPSGVSAWDSGTDNLVDLWDSSSAPATDPIPSTHSSNLVDLMGDSDVLHDDVAPSMAAGSGRPQPLLSFDEMMDGSFCSGTVAEDDPTSLVDVSGSDQMTLSYQHALQHASGAGQDPDDVQLLMTNGETLLKEGTQVRWVQTADDFQSFFKVWFDYLWCFLLSGSRPVRATSANHRRKNSANQRSHQLSQRLCFITSLQVWSIFSSLQHLHWAGL